MAIDFPSSPTNGQIYQGYYWDNAKQAWRSNNPATGSVIMSSTTPVGATSGDMWFNTSDGTMFVYYNDGITTQWVEIQANVDNYKTPSQNYIINGGFDVWQRGTSFGSTGYTADRFYSPISNATVSQETTDLPSGFRYGIKYVTTAANGFAQFNQPLESDIVISLRGKTVTASGWVKISGSFSGNWAFQALYSTSSDAYASQTTLVPGSNKYHATAATTSWTRFSHTFTIPNDAVGLRIENLPDVVSPSGVTVRMTGIQLEVGSVATPFRRHANSLQGEIAACQRYYYQSPNYGGTWYTNGITFIDFEDRAIGGTLFPVKMRTTPVVTLYAAGVTNGIKSYGANATRNVSEYYRDTDGVYGLAHDGGYTLGRPYSGILKADAEL